jgi:hypothetical protein
MYIKSIYFYQIFILYAWTQNVVYIILLFARVPTYVVYVYGEKSRERFEK